MKQDVYYYEYMLFIKCTNKLKYIELTTSNKIRETWAFKENVYKTLQA